LKLFKFFIKVDDVDNIQKRSYCKGKAREGLFAENISASNTFNKLSFLSIAI